MTYSIIITDQGNGAIEWGVLVNGEQVAEGQANYWSEALDQSNIARIKHGEKIRREILGS